MQATVCSLNDDVAGMAEWQSALEAVSIQSTVNIPRNG